MADFVQLFCFVLLWYHNQNGLQEITVKESSSVSGKELVVKEREFVLLLQEFKRIIFFMKKC